MWRSARLLVVLSPPALVRSFLLLCLLSLLFAFALAYSPDRALLLRSIVSVRLFLLGSLAFLLFSQTLL